MPGLVRIAVVATALLFNCAQGKRIRLRQDRFPTDVDSSFSQQETVDLCLCRVDLTDGNASHRLSQGALVLTAERLLAYVQPQSLLPSCTPIPWEKLSTRYERGQELMYVKNGRLEKARFETTGKIVADQRGESEQIVWYTPLTPSPASSQIFSQYDATFYPINDDRLLSPWKSNRCAYPEEAASIAIETIVVHRLPVNKIASKPPGSCWIIKGCPDDQCKKERVQWTACLKVCKEESCLYDKIRHAHLKKNGIYEVLGSAIRDAIAYPDNKFISLPEDSYPDIAKAFIDGIIPKKKDKTSWSGAASFYSSDKKYIAKRIRDVEFEDGLKALASEGKYRSHYSKGSTLCPTYIGFRSMGNIWIVMRREQLGPEIEAIIHKHHTSGDHSFFVDVKPHPMISDRVEFHALLGKEFLERGFKLGSLFGWESVLASVEADIKFLQVSDLVDYSFWIYGTLFDAATIYEKEAFEASMADVIGGSSSQRKYPGCAYGCQNPRSNPLVDMTPSMGNDNRITVKDAEFKCCCAEVAAITFRTESPCVLVNVGKKSNEMTLMFNKTGCGSLLGHGWHSFTAGDLTPANGKCLIGMVTKQIWAETPHIKDHIVLPDELGYRDDWLDVAPLSALPWRCGVVCVSIGDYFLRLGAWESFFENMPLVAWYNAQDWTDYSAKMARILHGMSASPPYEDDFVDAINAGMTEAIANRVEKIAQARASSTASATVRE